jgi:hypothetical protein
LGTSKTRNYVILERDFKNVLMKDFIKIASTKYNANKLTNISISTISNIINKKNPKIKIDFLLEFIKVINKNRFSLKK